MGGAPKPYMILEGMRVEHGPTVTAGGGAATARLNPPGLPFSRGLSSMRFHPTGGGPKTTKTDK